jgi:hypothetical protein
MFQNYKLSQTIRNKITKEEADFSRVSALELFVGFNQNEITYLEHNLLGFIREALKQVISEAKTNQHLSKFIAKVT